MDEFSGDGPMSCRQQRGDATARRWALARSWGVGLALALACQSALAQAMYRIKPLGYLSGCTTYAPTAYGFNGADEVTGGACNANGDGHAFLWKNDGTPMVDLGPKKVGSWSVGMAISASGYITGGWGLKDTDDFSFVSSRDGTHMINIPNDLSAGGIDAYAVNNSGQVTGSVAASDGIDGTDHAFLWKNDGSPIVDLGIVDKNNIGFDDALGFAINDSAQVAGVSGFVEFPDSDASVWQNYGKTKIDLGVLPTGARSYACCINASGQVAGSSSIHFYNRTHAFLWRNDGTPIKDLGTLGGADSFTYALNDSGQVVGSSTTLRFLNSHAFVWLNDGTAMKDLGTFGGSSSVANDLNASGQVTGSANLTGDSATHAFLWRNDGTAAQDLNTLIDPTDPLRPYVTLTSGDFINDLGDILAEGTDSRSGLSEPYLLQGTVLTLSPRSLAFGNQAIKTASAAQSVTMTNTSPKAAAITTIALTGTAAGQFTSTNNCGKSMAGHSTCTIKVTFKPTTKGAKSEVLNVNGGGGGSRSVKITGTGT
jgi:probable HAF family extracellular repeat protein